MYVRSSADLGQASDCQAKQIPSARQGAQGQEADELVRSATKIALLKQVVVTEEALANALDDLKNELCAVVAAESHRRELIRNHIAVLVEQRARAVEEQARLRIAVAAIAARRRM